MGNERPPFKPNTVFHVYNHGNAEDNIFREEENYYYFLERYAEYIYPIAKTYAFCLLPNHFHLTIKIRTKEELTAFFENKGKDLLGFGNLASLVSRQFSHFFNAYSKAFNNKYDRKGRLFRKGLPRKPITNKTYYKNLTAYIHQNPIEHGFVKHPVDWPFSSYQIILARKETQLERKKVLNWFGGREAFVEDHEDIDDIDRDEFY